VYSRLKNSLAATEGFSGTPLLPTVLFCRYLTSQDKYSQDLPAISAYFSIHRLSNNIAHSAHREINNPGPQTVSFVSGSSISVPLEIIKIKRLTSNYNSINTSVYRTKILTRSSWKNSRNPSFLLHAFTDTKSCALNVTGRGGT
jgi:hypothetical protein